MKKWFIFSAALLVSLAGCNNDDTGGKPADSVSINPSTDQKVDSDGGPVSVLVTSSGDWTLSADATYNWVSTENLTGKDGDIVVFNVSANDTENNQEAIYTFKVGKAEAKLKIISEKKSGPVTNLALISEPTMEIPKTKHEIVIKLDTDVAYRELEQVISPAEAVYHKDDNPDGWISFNVTLKEDDVVSMYFDVVANATFEPRTAEITITGGVDGEAKVTVTQAQTDRLTTEFESYDIDLAKGGSVEVELLANVEYDMTITDGDWLAYTNKDLVYTFTAPAFTEKRNATITFESKDGVLKRVITITQKNPPLITKAGKMGLDQRLFPEWTNFPTALTEMTLEVLVNGSNWNNINTIMGRENHFLMRLGDNQPKNQLEVVYRTGTGTGTERKLTNAQMKLDENRWYHIAVTYDKANKQVKVYYDGVLVGSDAPTTAPMDVNFGIANYGEYGSSYTMYRCFWIGYSYEAGRFWPGMMSEVRIWDKVLTEAEINATDHFYKIANPETETNLIAYWKIDEKLEGTKVDDYQSNTTGANGTGNPVYRTIYRNVIKDYSSKGNNLSSWNPLEMAEVSLP